MTRLPHDRAIRRSARFADLRTRAIWGFGAAALALAAVVIGGLVCVLLIAAVSGLMAWEWRQVTLGPRFEPALGAITTAATALAVLLAHFVGAGGAILYLLGAAAAIAVLESTERRNALWAPLGVVVIGLAGLSFAALRETEPLGLSTALWLGFVVVASDVGGYFAGRSIGGPKLWPAVSPNKTWAGLGGAVGLAAIIGALFAVFVADAAVLRVAAVSAAAGLVAQGGDLAESAFKRRFGAKDSGAVMPGHGGALDRLDGFSAATLAAALVVFARGEPVFLW